MTVTTYLLHTTLLPPVVIGRPAREKEKGSEKELEKDVDFLPHGHLIVPCYQPSAA